MPIKLIGFESSYGMARLCVGLVNPTYYSTSEDDASLMDDKAALEDLDYMTFLNILL